MKKNRKIIIIGVILLLIAYYGPTLFKFSKYEHKFEIGKARYLWVFKDSIRKNIDISLGVIGNVRERDALYDYVYCKNKREEVYITEKDTAYYVSIWEFKDLGYADFKDIPIKENAWLYNITFESGEIFNKSDSLPLITLKLGFEFKRPAMDVNLDAASKIYKTIDTNNYKGFFGKINKMSFSDFKGEHLILFEYKKASPTLFLMYKARQSFFVIMVNSNHEFDESIINIFNLK